MPAYKRQHYLPAAYLKYFSRDQTSCARDSWVWRFDGQEQRLVRVDSQCSAKYHYSKDKAAATEQMFQKNEDQYCRSIDKIRGGGKLSDQEYGGLLLNMFDFYIRNAVHQNNTGKERIEAYHMQSRIFWQKILLNNAGEIAEEDIKNHIYSYWGLRIVTAPAERLFLTSDHPSVWTSINDNQNGLHLLTLPITPTQTAVAYDRRILDVASERTSQEDSLTLNSGQIENSVTCVYASSSFTGAQMAIMKNLFATKPKQDCKVDEANWQLRLLRLPPEHYFSFIRLTPPLM